MVSPLRAMSFISRLRRSRQHRVSILSAYLVHPFPLRGTSPQGETRALRDWLSVSYGMISTLVISRCAAPLIRLRRTFPHPGDRINCSMLSCRDMAPWLSIHSATTKWWHQRKKRISSDEARLVCFSPGESPVVRFYHKRAPSII